MKNIVVFDRPYSKEKIQEGIAVQKAVITGECNKCTYLKQCESDKSFEFPKDSACMKTMGNIGGL